MCEEVWLSRSPSCEDIIAAISVPIIVEQEEYSLSAGDYIDRKRHQHEEVFRKMRYEIEKLNEYVDKDVEQYIEVAKEECKLIQNEIHRNNFDEITSVEQWLSVSAKNEKQISYISKSTNELAADLESVEKSRSEDIKKILSKYKDEAVAIGYSSIEDIENAFEAEIKTINLKMLDAFVRYEDINFQLQVEGQGIIDECHKHVKETSKAVAERTAQRLWKKVLEKQNRKLLNDAIYNLSQEKFRVQEDFSELAKGLAQGLSDLAEGLQLPTEYDIKGDYWEQWIETLNAKLASLETLCKSVEMLLKSAVSTLMENFNNQVNEFSQTMDIQLCKHLIGSESELDIANEIEEFRKRQAKELDHLQEKWQETVNQLNNNIIRSKTFVWDLTAIWTTHLARVNKLHTHIQTTLESSYNTSLKKYKENDTKLKGLVKSVREAKDVPKLNTLCETLKEKFQEQVMDLEDSYENQLEMMEDMKRKGVEELIKEKLSHINDFLNKKYRKKEWFFEGRRSLSIGSLQLSDSDFEIVGQVDLCNTYMVAVENRTLGMYEMLERYVPYCETSVREETEDWMNMFIQNIVNSYDGQVNEVSERQNKTLKDIKQLRFAEIQIHSRRLMSHINGAKQEFLELSEWYDDVKTKQIASLKEFNETVTARSYKQTVKGMKAVIVELEQEWGRLLETLTNRISTGKTRCEKTYTDVREASNLFLKTAKNFKNGGNYSPEELKTLNKELNQLGKFISTQNKSILRNYDSLAKIISRKTLDSKIEQIHEEMKELELQQSLVDTLSILRMRLRSEITTMKGKIKSVEEIISLLSSTQRICPDLFSGILALVGQTHSYMVNPRGVLSLECVRDGDNLAITTSSPTQKTNKSIKQNIEPLFKHTTDEDLGDESNFLTVTKRLIFQKYYSLLQNIQGKDVVSSSQEVKPKLNESKTKVTKQNIESDAVTQQIALIKHILRLYNSECELAWLSQARELLDQIVTLRKTFNTVTELELSQIHEVYMKSLCGVERDYTYSVNEGEPKRERERERVQQSLVLPLAHPSNHIKLSELREKAKDVGQLQKYEYNTYLMGYKKDLQNKHDSYVKTVKTLKDSLNDLQTALFSEDLCKVLTDNLKGIRNVVPYEDEIGENTLNANHDYPLSIWSHGSDIGHEFPPTRSICLILLPTSSSTSHESLSGESDGGAAKVPINKIAAEQVMMSAQKVQQLYDQARSSTETKEKTVHQWLKSFEHDVKEAKNFYSWPCKS